LAALETYQDGLVLAPNFANLILVLVAGYKNRSNLVLVKLQSAITFALTVRIGHIVYGFKIQK